MKYLIMTEGTCEKALLDLLVDRDLLVLSRSDLLYNEVYHLRQLNPSVYEKISQLSPEEKVCIIRIGDKLDDKFKIDDDFKERFESCEKVCTKPEFEMLHIIHEGKYKDFLKKKSKIKPCEYLKTIVSDYEKTYRFNYDYFDKMKDEEIKELLREYSKSRGKVHKKKIKSLEDLIR